MNLLREYIRNVIIEEAKSLGQIAFADQRKDVPKETNTDFENNLHKAIKNYFLDNKTIQYQVTKEMSNYLENNDYADIFHEPKTNNVYRGLDVGESFLKKFLNRDRISEEGILRELREFPSQDIISSWSTSATSASHFASRTNHTIRENKFRIMLFEKVSDNPDKFIDCDSLYEVEHLGYFRNEKEVLGIGNITISQITWQSSNINKRYK